MAINAVAPWEGALEWVGEPNEGKTQAGKDWKSVDFTLKYTDSQMNEKFITFSAFGVERVDKLLSLPIGTMLKVIWWPESNQARSTGKYYPKLNVISIGLVKPEAKPAETNVRRPDYPQQGTSVPGTAYAQVPTPQPPLPAYDGPADVPSDDLPFN